LEATTSPDTGEYTSAAAFTDSTAAIVLPAVILSPVYCRCYFYDIIIIIIADSTAAIVLPLNPKP
jgi:hypothetical protein